MGKVTEFDWIVEYETLPPDEPPLTDPSRPDPKPRRPPRWFWPIIGLVGIGGILFALWLLGGKAGPLPSPDPPATQLELAVRMEINALQSGDPGIFAQLQDRSWRRSNMQPPLQEWSASRGEGGRAGEIELIEVHLIDTESARADVKLTWDEIPYQLTWFYRLEQGRWLHDDWQQMDEGSTELIKSPHVQITTPGIHQAQAAAVAARLEELIGGFCSLLPCPAEPFRATLVFDHHITSYSADTIAPLRYRLPTPLRIRWPLDKRPEPLVLASTGRRLGFDLFARPHRERVSPENQAALTLSTFWLAHHLLGIEPLPTTRWLDEGVRRDGLPAAAAFINALSQDTAPQLALSLAFRPGTVAAITAMADYFGWLTLVMDPDNLLRPSPGSHIVFPLPWYPDLGSRFDYMVNPWATAGERTYGQAAPEMVGALYQADWAIATPQEGSGWGMAYFFRPDPDNEGWILARPDETLMGEQRSARRGPFDITYWAWDEAKLSEPVLPLDEVYRVVAANLGINLSQRVSVAVISAPEAIMMPEITADLYLASPALAELLGRETLPDVPMEVWNITLALLHHQFDELPGGGFYLLAGVFLWQIEQFELDFSDLFMPGQLDMLESWRPPSSAEAPGWRPLEDFWPRPPGPPEMELYPPALLTVAYLVERDGVEVLPLMLEALKTADSMADWVAAVTGQPLAQFEADWREWVVSKWKDR